jgi:toxin-antitoxin system PIN domain toxin
VAFSWSVLTAFIRLSTHGSVFLSPLSTADAMDFVEDWVAQPNVIVVEPTARHVSVLRGLIEPVGTAGNLVMDAHLAALAIEHGATVVSHDHDFGRFPGLRWTDPLSR